MKYSLAPVAKRLSELLGQEVKLAKDVVGEDAKKLASEVQPGHAVLLENVRFEKGETKNDAALAKAMADMAEIYVTLPPQASLITCRLYAASSSRRRSPSWARL